MKILGITAEYNPLHNGHVYQMEEALKRTEAEYCIVAMSGNFTQRGEPAIADKWIRARQVIELSEEKGKGADLVIELPFAFACNTARNFAAGGVDTLVKMGANYISFGCEAGNPRRLEELARKMYFEREALEMRTAKIMLEGFSRARAYSMAVEKLIDPSSAEIMRQPNNILAIEYYKRIAYWEDIGRHVEAVPIVRKGSSYDGVEDLCQDSGFAGASEIRKMIADKTDISPFVPSKILYESLPDIDYRRFIMLKAIIVRSSAEELKEIYGVGEGLHHKMKIEINDSYTMDEYVSRLVSKRYTEATIRRILTYVLLGVKKDEVDSVIHGGITFGRVLACGGKGRNLIRKIKDSSFNIITNINKESSVDVTVRKSLDISVRSSDVYNMLCGKDMYAFSDRVFRPYIVMS